MQKNVEQQLSLAKLNKYAADAVQNYNDTDPKTYAGAGFKTGAGLGALSSMGIATHVLQSSHLPLTSLNAASKIGRAGLAGGLLWGAIGGLAGGLKKRNDDNRQY